MRRAVAPLSIALLGALVFLIWMHPAVIWPTNVGWLLAGEDRGQSAVGLAAYLRAGAPWPGLRQPLLGAPEGMTLLFTDSIPLLGLLLKPLVGWLPASAQYIGLWYLLCALLQATFAWLLIRRHAADLPTAWLGTVLLTAMPVLINRFGHASLCAQWLILGALWIFVDEDRSRQPWRWALVLGLAALIHSYLLLMVASIWGSWLLRAMVRGPARGRTIVAAVVTVAMVVALVSLHGIMAGPYVSTESYGVFTVALDAWWNPANPDYTALLPSTPQIEGRGFEGFQYLGAGLLAVVVVAIGVAAASGDRVLRSDPLPRLLWLLPAFAVLGLVAIGPAPVWRGHQLFAVHLSKGWIDGLDAVRASGRLVWPITYTLIYVALAIVCSRSRAMLILGAALALQIVDLMPMAAAVRATSARADDPRVYERTLSPRWNELVARAGEIQFEPPENFRDLQLMEEIAWRAVQACRPVRFFYASRKTRDTAARIEADSRAFRAGRLDLTRLYVLLGGPVPATVAGRVSHLDGVALIVPTSPVRPSGCPPATDR